MLVGEPATCTKISDRISTYILMGTYQYICQVPQCLNPVGSNKQLQSSARWKISWNWYEICPISEGLDGRHIDMIASNETDGKEESNQLEIPLISNGSMLLERSKSKSDGNIGEESKFGPSNEQQSNRGMKNGLMT